MSSADKDKVVNLRKRSSEAKARIATIVRKYETLREEQPGNDAGNKFGRNSHKKGKKDRK